jgi:deoxyribodipyrimidine photo-lyase
MEYEVDELRRDLATLSLCKHSGRSCIFTSDRCIVEPGTLKTKQDKPYTVFSPWLKNWLPTLHDHPEYLEESPTPARNSEDIHDSPAFSVLFSTHVPNFVDGFECNDKEKMEELWLAGTDAATKVHLLLTSERSSDHFTGVAKILAHESTQVPDWRFFPFV